MRNTLIKDCPFAALDFESAGAERGETDQPVQIGIARCQWEDSSPELWTSYISPGKPVLWAASQVHGITSDMLAGAPSIMELWPSISRHLKGAVIIGHNLGTERRFLRSFPGHGFGPWLDTLTLARECLPNLANYSLQSVSEALGIVERVNALVPGKTWHDALYDAAASLLIFQTVAKELNLLDSPLACLGASLKS